MLGQETKDFRTNGAEAQQCNAYWLPFALAGAVEFLDGRRHAYSPKLRVVGFIFHSRAIIQNERAISALGLYYRRMYARVTSPRSGAPSINRHSSTRAHREMKRIEVQLKLL